MVKVINVVNMEIIVNVFMFYSNLVCEVCLFVCLENNFNCFKVFFNIDVVLYLRLIVVCVKFVLML